MRRGCGEPSEPRFQHHDALDVEPTQSLANLGSAAIEQLPELLLSQSRVRRKLVRQNCVDDAVRYLRSSEDRHGAGYEIISRAEQPWPYEGSCELSGFRARLTFDRRDSD